MKKVTKHYAFIVDDNAGVPILYAKAVCDAMRRAGLDIKVEATPIERTEDSEGGTKIQVTASFVPDPDLIEKVGA